MLELLLEEYFDLAESMKALEARRDALRAAIQRELTDAKLETPRGTVRIDRAPTFEAPRLGPLVPFVAAQGWEDETLSLKGRALHKVASADGDALLWLRDSGLVVESVRETMVITPRRSRSAQNEPQNQA